MESRKEKFSNMQNPRSSMNRSTSHDLTPSPEAINLPSPDYSRLYDPTGQYSQAYSRINDHLFFELSAPRKLIANDELLDVGLHRQSLARPTQHISSKNSYGDLEYHRTGTSWMHSSPSPQTFEYFNQGPYCSYLPPNATPHFEQYSSPHQDANLQVEQGTLSRYDESLMNDINEEPDPGQNTVRKHTGSVEPGDDESEVFANKRQTRSPSHRVGKKSKSKEARKRKGKEKSEVPIIRPFSHNDYSILSSNQPLYEPVSEDQYFNNTGKNLEDSRYSGATMPWGLNKKPVMVDSGEVADAALLKRNLPRTSAQKVCKRGYGANDPENIAIVNLMENDGHTFKKIVEILNHRRIEAGKIPSLTVCAVTSRYNRTAPLLFASQGRDFIPMSQRGGRNLSGDGGPAGNPIWNGRLDVTLVESIREVDAQRWFTVAALFTEETGIKMDAEAVGLRYSIL